MMPAMGVIGLGVDGANCCFSAVRDGGLVDAGTGISAPRCFGAGKDKWTVDLALLDKA